MAMEHILAKKDELTWSIYNNNDITDYSGWEEDLSTNAPSGDYVVTIELPDFRQDNYTPRSWNSHLRVKVDDEQVDQDSALMAAAELMLSCGYYGTFVEKFEYSDVDNKFHLTMGS